MPTGLLLLHGVPFRVIDPATNGGRSCVVLRDSINVADWHDAPLPNAGDHKFVPACKDRFLCAVQ